MTFQLPILKVSKIILNHISAKGMHNTIVGKGKRECEVTVAGDILAFVMIAVRPLDYLL